MVKRIVGLPGESVQIRDGEVYINGVKSAKPAFLQKEGEPLPRPLLSLVRNSLTGQAIVPI